jgi:hypothetical protein
MQPQNYTKDNEWGNIELPGFGDDKLFDPNLNRSLANKAKKDDPLYIANQKKAQAEVLKDPVKVKIRHDAAKKAGKTKSNDPYNKSLSIAKLDAINSDPTMPAKRGKTISKLHQDPNGPFAEWFNGRPNMDRTNITTEHLNSNPEIVKKRIENSRAHNASEEGRKKYLEGRKKIQVQYQDPNGKIWPSRKEAAAAWNIIPQTLSKLANKPNSGWKKL